MKITLCKTALSLVLILFSSYLLQAQTEPKPIGETEKKEVIDSIQKLLKDNYVFPEVAEKMNALLSKKLQEGQYKNINAPFEFAQQLTSDLQSISNDKHLRVGFNPEMIADMRAHEGQEGDPEEWIENMRQQNFGFKEVKLLEGNIGYLDLRGFHDAAHGGETAVAAMNFLANAKALIIDLRNNGGGSPSMIQLITSYLYGPEPVHLNNFYWRPSNENTQTWTLPHVPGKRRPDMEVYVLTSNRTFSAAEEFSYNLKNLERATLIGETTGGGAHPGGTRIATDRFTVWVPMGRAINPVTNTNWEGTGVSPHIEVLADEALTVAHIKALEKLMEKAESPLEKERLQWYVLPLQVQSKPVELTDEILRSYAGKYGPRTLTFADNKLYYQRDDSPKRALIALAEDLFMLEDVPYFRLKIMREEGKVVGLEGLYENGHRDRNMKDQ